MKKQREAGEGRCAISLKHPSNTPSAKTHAQTARSSRNGAPVSTRLKKSLFAFTVKRHQVGPCGLVALGRHKSECGLAELGGRVGTYGLVGLGGHVGECGLVGLCRHQCECGLVGRARHGGKCGLVLELLWRPSLHMSSHFWKTKINLMCCFVSNSCIPSDADMRDVRSGIRQRVHDTAGAPSQTQWDPLGCPQRSVDAADIAPRTRCEPEPQPADGVPG